MPGGLTVAGGGYNRLGGGDSADGTGEKPVNVNGLGNSQWVAMDYIDAMVHVFMPEAREFYNLENLWEDAPMTRLPDVE